MLRIYYNEEGFITEVTQLELDGNYILVEDEEGIPFLEGTRNLELWYVDKKTKSLLHRNFSYYDNEFHEETFKELPVYDPEKYFDIIVVWNIDEEIFKVNIDSNVLNDIDEEAIELYVCDLMDPNVLRYTIHINIAKMRMLNGEMVFFCDVDLPEKFSVYANLRFSGALKTVHEQNN